MRDIQVQGTGSVEIPPDGAIVSVPIARRAATAEDAFAESRRAAATLRATLLDAGASRVSTTRVQLGEHWEHRDRQRVRDGYVGELQLHADFDDVDAVEPALVALTRAGADSIGSVRFTAGDSERAAADARRAAIRDARLRAADYAAAAGVGVGPVLAIHEPAEAEFRLTFDRLKSMPFDDATPAIEPGVLTVSAKVRVVFAIVGDTPDASGAT